MKMFGKEFYITVTLMVITIFFTYWFTYWRAPVPMPLKKDILSFDTQVGDWKSTQNTVLDQRTLDVLRVSDYLDRSYYNEGKTEWISLFIAYFRSQVSGEAIHSPRNCMPGSGWNFTDLKDVTIEIAGERPVTVHAVRAIVVNGEKKMLSYYWYQSRGRFLTSEYWEKIYLVWDSMRYNRTDGALVRLTSPIPKEESLEQVDRKLQEFVRKIVPTLYYDYFPPAVAS